MLGHIYMYYKKSLLFQWIDHITRFNCSLSLTFSYIADTNHADLWGSNDQSYNFNAIPTSSASLSGSAPSNNRHPMSMSPSPSPSPDPYFDSGLSMAMLSDPGSSSSLRDPNSMVCSYSAGICLFFRFMFLITLSYIHTCINSMVCCIRWYLSFVLCF